MSSELQLAQQQLKLKEHIEYVSARLSAINDHCYRIDAMTKSTRNTIEQQFGMLAAAIANRKQQLLDELVLLQTAKTQHATKLYGALSSELALCQVLDSEITAYLANPRPFSEDPVVAQLCDRIDQRTRCQRDAEIDDAHHVGTVIKPSFVKKTKSLILSLLSSFGGFMLDHEVKSDGGDYQMMPEPESERERDRDREEEEEEDEEEEGSTKATPRHKRRPLEVSKAQQTWRQKQLDHAMQTTEFKKLIGMYPHYITQQWRTKQSLVESGFVDVPYVAENIGKKRWMGKYAKWRQWLHSKTE